MATGPISPHKANPVSSSNVGNSDHALQDADFRAAGEGDGGKTVNAASAYRIFHNLGFKNTGEGPHSTANLKSGHPRPVEAVAVDIKDEKIELLNNHILSGFLRPVSWRRTTSTSLKPKKVPSIRCYLTSNCFLQDNRGKIFLSDVISVSCVEGSSTFTVNSLPLSWQLPSFLSLPARKLVSLSFTSPSPKETLGWLNSFSHAKCFVFIRPDSLRPLEREGSSINRAEWDTFKTRKVSMDPLTFVVFVNPKSGRGNAGRLFHKVLKPVFELAGFKLRVKETEGPRHAEKMAKELDLSTCPQGIICVGGDGIVNEVLNGLFLRPDAISALSVPLGIIPAGSDNSLVFSTLGLRDPLSAALSIIKGGHLAIDAMIVRWEEAGAQMLAVNTVYFGFLARVLSLSMHYQKQFGPLKYFVAGLLTFLRLKQYNYRVRFLPRKDNSIAETENSPLKQQPISNKEAASTESSEQSPASVIVDLNPVVTKLIGLKPGSFSTRGKQSPPTSPCGELQGEDGANTAGIVVGGTRTRKGKGSTFGGGGWMPLRELGDGEEGEGGKEGWDAEAGEVWETREGPFLSVILCNHACQTVQCSDWLKLAPEGSFEDGKVDVILVRPMSQLGLVKFLLLLQWGGRHVRMAGVEYLKCEKVRVEGGGAGAECGVDGELRRGGQSVAVEVISKRCFLIGTRKEG